MLRRLIAVVGIMALSVAFLPGAIGDLSASALPNCCDGIMCPMHHMADGHILCDMGTNRSDTSLQSCPDNAQRYTAALTFVRVLPTVFFGERVVAPVSAAASRLPLNATRGVLPPPPRTSLA